MPHASRYGIGDIARTIVKEPSIEEDFDAIVDITASAICGTDVHLVRGTVPGMQPGTILGQEGIIGATFRIYLSWYGTELSWLRKT